MKIIIDSHIIVHGVVSFRVTTFGNNINVTLVPTHSVLVEEELISGGIRYTNVGTNEDPVLAFECHSIFVPESI
jgi:hypothetical protein